MAHKKQEPLPQPAEQEYEVVITSDATVRTTYRFTASSPEEALRIAQSGEYEPIDEQVDEQVDNGRDVYAEVDGKEIDLET